MVPEPSVNLNEVRYADRLEFAGKLFGSSLTVNEPVNFVPTGKSPVWEVETPLELTR